jgi:uncharacterized protein
MKKIINAGLVIGLLSVVVCFYGCAPEQKCSRQAVADKADEPIVDQVQIGDAESEKSHNQRGNSTLNGIYNQRNWRDAREGGFFSYDMKVLPKGQMILACTWWGGDTGREFDILVNDKQIAAVKIGEEHPDQFYTENFKIPADLTKGKDKVTVRFNAPEDGYAGGVFGLVMLKEKSPK